MAGPIDHYEVRWRPADSDGEWESMVLPTSATTATIKGVDRNASYVIEARSIGPTGLKSVWVDISHTVAGNSVPEVPSSVAAAATADGVKLSWTYVKNLKAGIDTCVERALSSSGPWTEITQTRARTFIATERTDGTFYYRLRSVDFNGTYSDYSAIVSGDPETLAELNADIATALSTAQNAQATADGNVVSFWQASPPTIGPGAGQAKVGDIWFDTDDGNKIYRVVGSSWVDAQDDALAQALAAASTAQATADGKVKTYFSGTAPGSSGLVLGDLWFNTTTKQLWRWSGTDWNQNIADVTVDQIAGNGANLLWDEYSQFNYGNVPGLSPWSCSVSYDATQSVSGDGAGSLKITIPADPANTPIQDFVYFGNSFEDFNFVLEGGKKYLISGYVRAPEGGASIRWGLKGDNGVLFQGVDNALTSGAFSRVSSVVDLTTYPGSKAILLLFVNRTPILTATYIHVDRIMVEEMKGNLTVPSAYQPGGAGRRALVAISNAATAQATADGKIDSFYQNNPPTVFSEGDIWFDTDDGNKIYTARSGSWVATPDSAIAQAIADAAGAQATADGKVKTFYQTTAPVASGVGDLWFKTDTKTLSRWNGSTWGEGLQENSGDGEFIVNGNFSRRDQGWWVLRGGTTMYIGTDSYGPYLVQNGGELHSDIIQLRYIPTLVGQRYKISCVLHRTGAVPDGTVGFAFRRYAPNQSLISYDDGPLYWNSTDVAGPDPKKFEIIYTVPAGTYFIQVALVFRFRTVGNYVVRDVKIERLPDNIEEVPFGPNYGYIHRDDLYNTGGFYRNGLRFGASGHRLGSQRNFLQVGATTVRSTTALSATSAGAISVNAHSVRYGSFSITYSAVSNAITGKAQSSTWVIYCIDPDFLGGAQTWLSAANPDTLYQQGDGVYLAGQITIPTSGSSSGGGGSSGPGPDDWCVELHSQLPTGETAYYVEEGDEIACCFSPDDSVRYLRVTDAPHEYGIDCLLLETESGASIMASVSTPMILKDGELTRFDGMLGKEAMVLRYNRLGMFLKDRPDTMKKILSNRYLRRLVCSIKWEKVVGLRYVGRKGVSHIKVQNQCYFAGRDGRAFIATHNPIWTEKP